MYLVKEGGRPVPPLPTVFFKGSNSIAGHGDIVEIPKICQDDQADYEGELVVIIGKDAKNVSKEDALDYVLGYTAGDDVSSRYDARCYCLSSLENGKETPNWRGEFPNGGFQKGIAPYIMKWL